MFQAMPANKLKMISTTFDHAAMLTLAFATLGCSIDAKDMETGDSAVENPRETTLTAPARPPCR